MSTCIHVHVLHLMTHAMIIIVLATKVIQLVDSGRLMQEHIAEGRAGAHQERSHSGLCLRGYKSDNNKASCARLPACPVH